MGMAIWGKKRMDLLHSRMEVRDYGQLADLISERSRWRQDSRWECMSETCWKPQKTNSLFTPLTRTRQDCVSLSVSAVWTRLDETVSSSLDPVFNFQFFSSPGCISDWTVANWKLGWDETKRVETGSRQDRLSCLVASCVHITDADKTRQDSFVLSVSAVWTSFKEEESGTGNEGVLI